MNPTDTNQASELYELCREVYKRTGWKYTIGRFHNDGSYDGYMGHRGIAYMPSPQDSEWLPKDIPLYTSDYLLEKLPNVQNSNEISYFLQVEKQSSDLYIAGYIDIDGLGLPKCVRSADTPLKALLKLCLALKEAGEI